MTLQQSNEVFRQVHQLQAEDDFTTHQKPWKFCCGTDDEGAARREKRMTRNVLKDCEKPRGASPPEWTLSLASAGAGRGHRENMRRLKTVDDSRWQEEGGCHAFVASSTSAGGD
jgi:hypothetical protein